MGYRRVDDVIEPYTKRLIERFKNEGYFDEPEKSIIIETINDIMLQSKEDYEKGIIQNAWKENLKAHNEKIVKKWPEVDLAVLTFITELTCSYAVTEDAYEIMRSTFRAGYCWHFAHLLKDTFGRGEVCWAAPFGHMVWVDENDVPYDAEGANFGEQMYHIPESYLGEHIKNYMHLDETEDGGASREELIRIIRKYEDDNGLPYKEIKYI